MTPQDYSTLFMLGQGGVGNVHLAEARASGDFRKLVVLKSLKPEIVRQPGMREAFLAEARLCARLNHPNIVQVLSVLDDGGVPRMAMEYLEGQTLVRLLRDDSGACPLVLKLYAIAEALAGLAYFHDLEDHDGTPLRPVHRDVSPQNVFITYEGTVKILDFGIAKSSVRSSENSTETGIIKGKIQYMPPEQILGGPIDAGVDLYAAGAMLWEAVARRRMWEGQTDGHIMKRVLGGEHPHLPEDVDACPAPLRVLIEKALANKREERFASASEMRAALVAVIESLDPYPEAAALRTYMQEHYAIERSAQLRRIRDALRDANTEVTPLDGRRPGPSEGGATAKLTPPVASSTPRGRRAALFALPPLVAVACVIVGALWSGRKRPSTPPPVPSSSTGAGASLEASAEPPAGPCTGTGWADFEDGWAHLCAAPGRGGRFVLYSDGTGTLDPPIGFFGRSEVLPQPRGESRRALHWVGKNLTDWGTGMDVPLNEGKPMNLSTMEGVALWMRSEKGPVNVLVEIATSETLDATFGGACHPTTKQVCDDHYCASRAVSVFWTPVRVRFDQLRQLGFGVHADWDPSHAVELHVAVKRDLLPPEEKNRPIDFDLWVDDIWFF